MARRKLLHAGLAVSLFLTFLAAAGIYHKTTRHPNRKVASRLITELINGITFSETVLLPGIYMILPMVLGIFAAASFAGEYEKGHLRAVAIRPVSRWQIFIGKFVSLSLYSYLLLGILMLVSYCVGSSLFGFSGDVIVFGPAFLGKGAKVYILPESIAWQRLVLSYFFAGYSLISLTAMFMMFSAIFKRPAVATVFPLGIYYTSYILDALPFMDSLRRFLPTRYLMIWKYVMAESVRWQDMAHDGMFLLAYTAAYLIIGGIAFSSSDL